jgi:hypothetical protein
MTAAADKYLHSGREYQDYSCAQETERRLAVVRELSIVLDLPDPVVAELRAQLPHAASQTVAAIIAEVPGYTSALGGPMGIRIEDAVRMALRGLLNLASQPLSTSPLRPALDAAYALGRGEARDGRSMDALLAAYRIGARVSWRELAAVAVDARLPATTTAQFAELVFAYIDELSAASVSGHADELATSGRVQQRYLDRLARALLAGDPADALQAAAGRAAWQPPDTLSALLMPDGQVHGLRSLVDPRTLVLSEDLPGIDTPDDTVVLLVADLDEPGREWLKRELTDRSALLGPARPWTRVRVSYERALRARRLHPATSAPRVLDTEEHLVELVIGCDDEALADLRTQVLAPLSELSSATAEKLAETLGAWLLHQGRRADVAAALFVHPQTVRYRMSQLRELYGDQLHDPATVLALCIALGAAGPERRAPTPQKAT